MTKDFDKFQIAIVGLGYVGLPLAIEFAKKYSVIGYDINQSRVSDLQKSFDKTLEVEKSELLEAKSLAFTSDLDEIRNCNIYIIGVPTPVNNKKEPDFKNLCLASEAIGSILNPGDIVIYESTVYPGATEEICVPILEEESNLKFNEEFYVGYSPERINPGDKEHRLPDIKKVTSGSTPEIATTIDELYKNIISAGTHKVSSIRVAEAAKVIENTQRDVNIGLINELATIFNKLSIDTEEVLEAAGTKWNFLPFRPGLVGGHCIGVDPYYLSYKAQSIGYQPEMILAGRRINDGMSSYIVKELSNRLLKKDTKVEQSKILIMGLTFKENCPDIRNTKVFEIIDELEKLGAEIDTYDPWVDKTSLENKYIDNHIDKLKKNDYDAVIIAVAHEVFKEIKISEIKSLCKSDHIIYDLKYLFPSQLTDMRL
ncbi:nucleotide sugar dehydrogenase [Gammaproteobacteria bacterium]|nr:nucleotide sugar dehydrogenase [Gammaproteobacteria bacterium]